MTVRTSTTDDTGYEGGTEGSEVDTLGLNWDEEAARGGAVMDTTSSMVSTITSCDANYSTTTNNNNNNEITDDNIKKSYCNDRNVDEAKESALEHEYKSKDDDQDDTTTTQQYHGHSAEDDTADGVILLDEQDEESSEQTTSNCPGAYHVPGPAAAVVAWTGDDLSTATPLTSTGTPLTSTRGDTPTSLATGTPSSVMATQGHVNAALRAAARMRQNSIDNELDRLGIHRVDAEAVPISEAVPLSEDGINSSGNDEQQQQEIVYDAEPVTPKRTLKILGLEVPASTLVWIALCVIPMSTLLIGLMVAVNNKDDDQQLPAVVEQSDPNSFDGYKKCMSLVGDSAKCNFKVHTPAIPTSVSDILAVKMAKYQSGVLSPVVFSNDCSVVALPLVTEWNAIVQTIQYDEANDEWLLLDEQLDDGNTVGDRFGASLDISEDGMVLGVAMPRDDPGGIPE